MVFLFGLEAIASSPVVLTWLWYLSAALPLLMISLLASRRLTKRYTAGFIPGLFSLVVPVLLSLISTQAERRVFVFLAALMYYFSLLGIYRLRHSPKDKTAQAFLNTAAMAAMFFFFAGAFGFYLNFSFPSWGLMLLIASGAALTSYATFLRAEIREKRRVQLYSLLIGFIMGEAAWVLTFWPFGYLTMGATTLIFYFIVWDISVDAFRNTLSLRKAIGRLLFFVLLIALLLISSPWRILV